MTEETLYRLGTAEQINEALKSVKQDSYLEERLYLVVANKLANSEKVRPGIALSIMMTAYDVGIDGQVMSLMQILFLDDLVDGIIANAATVLEPAEDKE